MAASTGLSRPEPYTVETRQTGYPAKAILLQLWPMGG